MGLRLRLQLLTLASIHPSILWRQTTTEEKREWIWVLGGFDGDPNDRVGDGESGFGFLGSGSLGVGGLVSLCRGARARGRRAGGIPCVPEGRDGEIGALLLLHLVRVGLRSVCMY